MRDPKIKKYIKKLDYSYAMGTYPTLDLLRYKPERAMKVLLNSKGGDSEGVRNIITLCKEKNIKFEIADDHIRHIAVKENTYTIGIFEKYNEELDQEESHIVLDKPRNMGNIGTIVRTMVGFGFNNLAIIKPAADIFDPTIVRSAMGALFQIHFSYFNNYEEYLSVYSNHKQYLMMLDGAKRIEDVKFERPFSLVLGNESEGLPEEYKKYGEGVYIKHSDKIDSLNLSIAGSIGMYISSKKTL